MNGKILSLLLTAFTLFGCQISDAAISSWRQQLAASCTSLTTATSCGGLQCIKQDLCWDITQKVFYTCDPETGTICDSSDDWKAGGGGWLDDGTNLVPLNTSRNIGIGTAIAGDRLSIHGGNIATNGNLIKGHVSNGIKLDADANNSSDVTISPAGLITTSGGFNFTGADAFLNIARATNRTSPSTGDLWYNSALGYWAYWDGAQHRRLAVSQTYSTLVFGITSSTTAMLFKAPTNIRIESIACITNPGGTGTVVINITGCSSTGSSCTNVDTASITCTGTGATDDGSLSSPAILSGNYVGISTGAITGTPTYLTLTIKYYQQP